MGVLIEHLKKKSVHIIVTNVCNLSCGGCSQHCGLFSKDKLFFISKDQFEINVDVASKMHKYVHVFGGEACLHPEIESFLSICESKYPNTKFFIWTNGKYKKHKDQIIKTRYAGVSHPHSFYKNVIVQVDFEKSRERTFIPTLVAPQDIVVGKNKRFFFEEYAQKNCYMFKSCQLLFYDKYAYACECGGSFDKITNFDKGWPIFENFLDKLTDEDVIEQLSNFCYRCGHCLPKEIRKNYVQKVSETPICSSTNKNITNKDIIVINSKKIF